MWNRTVFSLWTYRTMFDLCNVLEELSKTNRKHFLNITFFQPSPSIDCNNQCFLGPIQCWSWFETLCHQIQSKMSYIIQRSRPKVTWNGHQSIQPKSSITKIACVKKNDTILYARVFMAIALPEIRIESRVHHAHASFSL